MYQFLCLSKTAQYLTSLHGVFSFYTFKCPAHPFQYMQRPTVLIYTVNWMTSNKLWNILEHATLLVSYCLQGLRLHISLLGSRNYDYTVCSKLLMLSRMPGCCITAECEDDSSTSLTSMHLLKDFHSYWKILIQDNGGKNDLDKTQESYITQAVVHFFIYQSEHWPYTLLPEGGILKVVNIQFFKISQRGWYLHRQWH